MFSKFPSRDIASKRSLKYTYPLHLRVLFLNQVFVAEAHLTVTSGLRVSIRGRLEELMKRRRRLNEVDKGDRLL